jgi:hypothetical protein
LESIELSAYPNPAISELNIKVDWADDVPLSNMVLTLSNLNGKIVATQPLNVNNNKFDVSTLKAGNYIYSIQYNGSSIKSGRIVKK